MIFLHGLALAVYEVQRYLKYRGDQRLDMLKREGMIADAMEAAEKAKVAAAVANAEYAAWKEALNAAALEAERVSAYLRKNAGTPAALEAKRLAAVATEKAHSAAAALEAERVAAAVAMEKAQSAAALDAGKVSAAAANLSNDEDAAAAVAASKVKTVPVKQDKSKKKGMFGGMKTGFML